MRLSLSSRFLKNDFFAKKKRFRTHKELKSEFSSVFARILTAEKKKMSFNAHKLNLIHSLEVSIKEDRLRPKVRVKAFKILDSFKSFLDELEK